ncbi:MAG: type IV secretion system DNA-binding domain-containing protein [Chitinophagales bacterium]|nr:type IV secretion system DNA-binding domain-containing protein [Chitinophagales bacterium]
MFNHFNPQISYFATTDFRNTNEQFGIKQNDRMVGLYILGKTGTGKTNLLETLIYQDIYFNRGICVMDVNGDLIKKVASMIPNYRKENTVYLDTSDVNLTWGYNPLKRVAYPYRHLIASHIIETFQKLWGQQAWGIKLEHILRNVILTLLDQEKSDFTDINRILVDSEFRKSCMNCIVSKEVLSFWEKEFPSYSKADVLPVLNKVGSFMAIPTIKKILVDNKVQISIGDIVNNQKVMLVNLSKGTLGVDAAHLLGSLLLNAFSSAGFYRTTIPESERKPFFIYLDEFQNFTTLSLVNMFAELRKFKIAFILAHQYLGQLNPKIKDAIMGNIGSIVCFRMSYDDAKYMAHEFFPYIEVKDFINLQNYRIYTKLLIDGMPGKPLSASTIRLSAPIVESTKEDAF